MELGEWIGERFVPSHELVARFHGRFACERLVLSEEQAEAWLAGRDLRGSESGSFPRGAVVPVVDGRGRFLGRARILDRRVRNLLPRRVIAI
jgi:NOL1/NOP2/fmu family ribosome biogenesis protein